MKPVEVDVTIDLNGRQITQSIASLKKIRRKMCQAELVINDEPPQEEQFAMRQWKQKMHDLIEVREKFDFPSYQDVKSEWDQHKKIIFENESKRIVKPETLPPKSLAKLIEGREQKRFGPWKGFGPKGDRPVVGNGSSLPSQIGPNYYVNSDPQYLHHSIPSYASTFQATERDPKLSKSITKREFKLEMTRSRNLRSSCRSQPSHSRPISCEKPHSREEYLGERNVYSRQSAESTMLRDNPLSNKLNDSAGASPVRITFGENSLVKTAHKLSRNIKIIPKHPRFDPYESANSLTAKLSNLGQASYKIRDYTMDALSLQVTKRPQREEQYVLEYDDNESFSSVATIENATKNNNNNDSSNNHHRHNHHHHPQHSHSMPAIPTAAVYSPSHLKSAAVSSKTASSLSIDVGNCDSDAISVISNDADGDAVDVIRLRRDSELSGADSQVSPEDVFRIHSIDKALSELAEVYGLAPKDIEESRFSEKVPKKSSDDPNLTQFLHYAEQYKELQDSKSHRGVTITATMPPISEDIRPTLNQWYKDRNIYSPLKPQTVRYLKEHKSAPPVLISGILFDTTTHTSSDIQQMIKELEIPPSYFALPLDNEPFDIGAKTALALTESSMSRKASGKAVLKNIPNSTRLSARSSGKFIESFPK